MKYSDLQHKHFREDSNYYFAKTKSYLFQFIAFNKKSRTKLHENYVNQYVDTDWTIDSENGIPTGKYYSPRIVITSDIILKENISQLKHGLLKLVKCNYSHNYYGMNLSVEDIVTKVNRMDSSLSVETSWTRLGRFDFSNSKKLSNLVEYFDIYIRNFNSSYITIEFHIFLAERYIHKQENIINNNYQAAHGFIISSFATNKSKNGAKTVHNISYYSNSQLKSDLLFENICLLKQIFFTEIQHYFKTILQSENIIPPSLNVYRSNLSFENTNRAFLESIGLYNFLDPSIGKDEILYFANNLSPRYKEKNSYDVTYIFNDSNIKLEDGFYSLDFQIDYKIFDRLYPNWFKFSILNALNSVVNDDLKIYKAKLNIIKLKHNSLNRLLKLHYKYEKHFDYFNRFIAGDVWSSAEKDMQEIFENEKNGEHPGYKYIMDEAVFSKNNIMELEQ